jgi:hypothetical protein
MYAVPTFLKFVGYASKVKVSKIKNLIYYVEKSKRMKGNKTALKN